MSKIGETHNDLPADSQCFLQYPIGFFHLLETLVEDDIIKELIGVVGQAMIDIIMKDT